MGRATAAEEGLGRGWWRHGKRRRAPPWGWRQLGFRGQVLGGCPPLEKFTGVTRFAGVIQYGLSLGGTGRREWQAVRVVPDKGGRRAAVLAQGKRTHGALLSGGRVLALAAASGSSSS
jgi:hypothetical protein